MVDFIVTFVIIGGLCALSLFVGLWWNRNELRHAQARADERQTKSVEYAQATLDAAHALLRSGMELRVLTFALRTLTDECVKGRDTNSPPSKRTVDDALAALKAVTDVER